MSFKQLSADSGEEVLLQNPFDEEKVGEGDGSEIHGVVDMSEAGYVRQCNVQSLLGEVMSEVVINQALTRIVLRN